MDEFQRQLDRNQQSVINEFNTKPEFDKVRMIYKNNFDKIVLFIAKSNPRSAIEDIASFDSKSAQVMFDDMLLFQEVNRAIAQQNLTLNDIK